MYWFKSSLHMITWLYHMIFVCIYNIYSIIWITNQYLLLIYFSWQGSKMPQNKGYINKQLWVVQVVPYWSPKLRMEHSLMFTLASNQLYEMLLRKHVINLLSVWWWCRHNRIITRRKCISKYKKTDDRVFQTSFGGLLFHVHGASSLYRWKTTDES